MSTILSPSTRLILAQLNTNKHLLSHAHPDGTQIIAEILACFTTTHAAKTWYLLGTDGCHLCQIATQTVNQALSIITNPPTLATLDLSDSSDLLLVDMLGSSIPILIANNRLLCYPFGLMDITQIINP
ncbi:Uncharacterised protein [Moraxella cuniculi]|uniref:Glutaredoxin-like domain (DUF836) n=1 Tax=Moraxella cuniculi TaxID=34061 RepID=A0A448GY64_9GAMM|nr:Uncharacterised protein [Moraxella cuniculi]